ncbi:MAG TPA: ABC transporter permease [Thermoanaerobaculia bacterium]|jgi:predicted permease|nr:ABC transporter permease [Thermoanaerobaculia bacterium]
MNGLRRTLRSLVLKSRSEREMDDELSFHIDMATARNIRLGMDPALARTEALRAFGGVEKTKEQCREARGGRWIEQLGQDLRYGARTLRMHPGYAAVVVLILALGIGANTAMFSAVNAVLLRPLPYADGDRLVVLHQKAALTGVDDLPFSPVEMADYERGSRSFSNLVEHHSMGFNLLDHGEPSRVRTGVVSWDFFDVLGVKPLLGRTFRSEDETAAAEPVLILSYEYWQRQYGGDPKVVGRSLRMNDKAHLVIGVLPQVPRYPTEDDVYMPTTACPFRSDPHMATDRAGRMLTAFGRLRPGVSLDQGNAEVVAVAARLREDHPDAYPAAEGYEAGLLSLRSELTREARPKLLLLLGTVGLVLLIVCANVANLALARLLHRQKELALRSALGAGRGRIARQLLTESALLALAGGLAGLLLAVPCLRLMSTFAARFTPRAAEIGVDGNVLLFTLAVSLAAGLIAGAAPALARQNPAAMLKEGGDRGDEKGIGGTTLRLRNLLIVFQLAASFMLLIGAGLTLRSLLRLEQVNPGFRLDRVSATDVVLDWSKYAEGERRWAFYAPLLEKVRSQPGFESVALGSTFPLNESQPWNNPLVVEGRPADPGKAAPQVDLRIASTGYFETLGIPVLEGRSFTDQDTAGAPEVVIVNRSLARRVWPDRPAINQRISLDGGKNWRTVVGVVGDVKQYGLDSESADEIYRPLAQFPILGLSLLVRSDQPAEAVEATVRRILKGIDPEQPVFDTRTLQQVRAESLTPSRVTTTLIALFAVLALAITAAGIAGILAFSVGQRTHEIGIRMAMGAVPGDVLRMILRQAALLVLPGLALGMLGALALTRLMTGLLFGVEPTDPFTFVAVSLLLLGVAAVACLIPARRATEIHPMVALRGV